ncbi:MAG TPA: ABC transporter ATP-binding protein [Acidimicrobiia bacterium]|nr:ABC transporter ATP-binding protein [Acidimicrobiia bacterium]
MVSEGLTKSFTPDAGVFDLDLTIPQGKIVGFIGPSGSGKTTTVRLFCGLLRPDRGSVEVLGGEPTEFDSDTRARLGYMPQHAILYPDLTLAQNLRFAASLYGLGRGVRSRLDDLTDFLDLGDAMDRRPPQASGGEQRRLMLAATLAHAPELMFLDEPTAGIDPVLRRRIWDRLHEISEAGATLIVTTQYVGEAADCDYVAVLADGRMLLFETPEGLRRAAYDGELVDIVFGSPVPSDTLDSLNRAIGGQTLERIDSRTVRLVVDDAGTAGPAIARWGEEQGVTIDESEAYVPSFDDVFVKVVERHEDESQDETETAPDVASARTNGR